jgi:hypothetical protein
MIPGNLLNSLPRFAMGLGTVIEDIQTPLIAAIANPRAGPGFWRGRKSRRWCVRLEYCAKISLHRHCETTDETIAPFHWRKPC